MSIASEGALANLPLVVDRPAAVRAGAEPMRFLDIHFDDDASEAAYRLSYEGSPEQVREFLRRTAGRDDEETCNLRYWLVLGANRAQRMEPLRAFAELGLALPEQCEWPFRGAAGDGWDEAVLFFIEQGIPVNAPDDKGRTALGLAAEEGRCNAVRILLEHGADLHLRNDCDESPLYSATRNAHPEVVGLLLQSGAAPNELQGPFHETPLHRAARGCMLPRPDETDERYRRVIRVLLAHGARIDARDATGAVPLHCAAQQNRQSATKELLQRGAALDAVEEHGHTALHLAALFDCDATAKLLLKSGAQIESRNRFGETPLHRASRSPKVAQLLIASGADVNARDEDGDTPLHHAALWGNVKTIKLFLTHAADREALGNSGKTAADLAFEEGHPECARFILEFR
jgi:cytohesin